MDYKPIKRNACTYFVIKIVNCTLCSWSRKSRTAFANISMLSCFPCFIVRWILIFVDQPTHENHENWYPTNKWFHSNVLKFFIFEIRNLNMFLRISICGLIWSLVINRKENKQQTLLMCSTIVHMKVCVSNFKIFMFGEGEGGQYF